MSHIDAAEESMPVGVVGLSLPQMHQSMLRRGACRVDQIMDAQHLLMLVVHFRITDQKAAPESAMHELHHMLLFVLLQLVEQLPELISFARRQRPLCHLDIGRGGNIDAAESVVAASIFAQWCGAEPLAILLK